jgi:ribosome-associated protein
VKNFRKLAIALAKLVYDKKCEDIVVLDVRKLTSLCDYFIIATVNSQLQMNTVHKAIDVYCSKKKGFKTPHTKSISPSWQVLDYVGIVIHLMTPSTREFYRIERLWYRAREISWHDKTRTKRRNRTKTKKQKHTGIHS